jgi:hypothetical protein
LIIASNLESALGQAEFGHNKVSVFIEISKLKTQVDELPAQDLLMKLFSRIANIRQLGYKIQTNLETDHVKAAELWVSMEPSLKEKIESRVATYRKKAIALEADIKRLQKKKYASPDDISDLKSLKKSLPSFKAEVADFISQLQRDIDPLPSLLTSIEQRVSTAETALDLTSAASFKLKEDEALVIAVKAKDMNRKTDGVLTFTNKRMMYESLPTKKKERQLLLDKPVGSVAKITKGKVGFFAPEGLDIEFKTPSDRELKFSTKFGGGEADLAVQYFEVITSGKIDEELKSGVSVAVRRRFKELAALYFPSASFCHGTCRECGTVVSTPIKTFTLDGGPITGLFDCPECRKPFMVVLSRASW